jgi:Uma2 family endonuclease
LRLLISEVSSMSIVAPQLLTAKEFAALPPPADGSKQELVRGVVITMPPPRFRHGECQAAVCSIIRPFVRANGLGRVTVESGLQTEHDPDSVRGPDVAFWSKERLPLDQTPEVYPDVAADLVVEVLSPSTTRAGMNEKIREYFTSGVRLVWVVDPEGRTVTIYRQPGEGRVVWDDATLSGEDVLPDFTCPVAEFFA